MNCRFRRMETCLRRQTSMNHDHGVFEDFGMSVEDANAKTEGEVFTFLVNLTDRFHLSSRKVLMSSSHFTNVAADQVAGRRSGLPQR